MGVKIMDFDVEFLDMFMNFTSMFSNSVMKLLGGFGSIAAMLVNLDIIHALAMLTLPVLVGLMLFQSCISVRAFAIALFQLTLKSVREHFQTGHI